LTRLLSHAFSSHTSPGFSPKATIVGTGTTTPAARLTVKNLAGNAPPASTGTVQSVGHYARFADNTDLALDLGGNSGAGNWLQSTKQNNLSLTYPLLLNPTGGSVGIGSPSATLDVNGSTRLRSLTTAGAGDD
jgi:hypothetical protein